MVSRVFEWMDRFEIGINNLDWWWIPRFFSHKSVWWKGGDYADEYGMFWFSLRFSFYTNMMSYREQINRHRQK